MRKRQVSWRRWLPGVLACVCAFAAGIALRNATPLRITPVAWADEVANSPGITWERQMVGDQERGVVKIDNQTVVELRAATTGATPAQRAEVIAGRLQQALALGAGSPQVYWEMHGNEAVVRMANVLIATASGEEAAAQYTTPASLAQAWATAIATALEAYGGGFPRPPIRAELQTVNNQEVAVVLIGEATAMQIWTPAGGFSPYERADAVTRRLNQALDQGLQRRELVARQVDGVWAVVAGDTTLITANQQEADRRDLTPQRLADTWLYGLSEALYGEAPISSTPGETWTPAERYDQKLVPVLSVLRGVRVGVAQVQGPYSLVHQVEAVAQLEFTFQKAATINVYVPIDTQSLSKLSRVQGVGLTGLADIRVVR